MYTIFTIPKPFFGHNGVIQSNAINSWLQLSPKCEIILVGDDDGVKETSSSLNLKHIANVKTNLQGTPMLDSAFQLVQKCAKFDDVVYVNADIIFDNSIVDFFMYINLSEYLICGRRWDMDVTEKLDFTNKNPVPELINNIETKGSLHGISGMDYFIFKKGSVNMRAFAVGRPGWDSWFLFFMKSKKIPIIDATQAITIIHQNHDYSHSKFGSKKRVDGPEWKQNLLVAGGTSNMLTMRNVDLFLTRKGIVKPPLKFRIIAFLTSSYVTLRILGLKRRIFSFIRMSFFELRR